MKMTALYAGILGIMYLFLSGRIMLWRFSSGVLSGPGEDGRMLGAQRAQGNFFEYVPMALVLLILVDFSMADDRWIHGLGGGLVAGRFLHALGMYRTTGISFGRRVGTGLTVMVMACASGLCILHGLS